jgi:hypothetical protein
VSTSVCEWMKKMVLPHPPNTAQLLQKKEGEETSQVESMMHLLVIPTAWPTCELLLLETLRLHPLPIAAHPTCPSASSSHHPVHNAARVLCVLFAQVCLEPVLANDSKKTAIGKETAFFAPLGTSRSRDLRGAHPPASLQKKRRFVSFRFCSSRACLGK